MMMPAAPGAHLVIAHPQFLLAYLETEFNGPSQSAEAHQLGVRHVGRGVREEVFDLALGAAATQQQPHVRAGQAITHGHDAPEGKVGDLGTLAAFSTRMALPSAGRQSLRQVAHIERTRGIGQDAPRAPCLYDSRTRKTPLLGQGSAASFALAMVAS
ncbi:MAG: hypothetical protein H0T73_03710 [Ardenticatenales bacterium]|nr:hypothetical protein [Ardenticatenales bacterium]